MTKIACIGEVMIELAVAPPAPEGTELKALSYAGDTYNTVVTLARLGTQASYITRLGDDNYSDAVISRLQAEHIGSENIVRQQGKVPGLYMIHNTPDGEREFFYWRDRAPARELFHHEAEVSALEASLADCNMVYLSGITLAIIGDEGRSNLLSFLRRYKDNGGKVAFDSNYRPRLWQTPEQAQQANRDILGLTDLALLTLDDEELLWGTNGDAVGELQHRYANCDIAEIVLKRGSEDVVILQGQERTTVPVPKVTNIVDTTAAGDTFNAGYLAAHLEGKSPEQCAQQANRCASVIIRHRGGVIDKSVFLNEVAER
ncbi:sugar kinase [Gilvimarinus agarilyticus]|uniref:sugar kinase n=1 Tax=unclassified Gilvimarinus TaxID=2642066 RepID=UPI001C08EEE7|nr:MULTISPECIES: sugar kinase [unclassified Gilvimarinus]MBU2885275.1 sugar kinase [Gilvimarinus agarilyticus]MDO6570172.1 sugar kinase [Gilvimarinus sp. 2_MG-2023]MDO6748339.1 sugar kinase [Gilvimarinus sp. 1_MG-2023]